MNTNIEVSDDHIIQINIPTPDQSHEQTPIATSTNSSAPKHESRGVNEMTPEELSSLKEDLTRHIWSDEWLESKSIIDKCPDLVRIPLSVLGDTALHLAVTGERLEIVKELVNRMRLEDMLIPNCLGDTALHLTVKIGSLEIVKELVECMRPEDMLIPNSDGDTALHLAVKIGSLEIVEELVKRMRPEDMLIPNSFGETAFHLAVTGGRLEIVNELVKRMRPEDMLIPNFFGDTALHLAVKRERLEIVNELVKRVRPEDMLIPNSFGDIALHLAVYFDSLEIVKELVKRMRPEDMLKPNSDGDTTLHLAADRGRLEIVKELVKRMRPKDMLIPNSAGDTALHLTVKIGSLEIVNELVERMRPEDMLIPNSDGMLPVHLAALYRSKRSIVDILSSQKILDKMDFKDIERLFMMTIRYDMFDLAMRLFEIHPTTLAIARNEENLTALHMLARKSLKNFDMRPEARQLFEKLCTQANQLQHKRMIMSSVLSDAIKSGNYLAGTFVILTQPELVRIKDPENGRNGLHLVVLFQQKKLFARILSALRNQTEREVDNEGNNILHLAAHLPPVEFEEFSSLRASIQMQRDFAWFQFVERNVHDDELRTMRNNMGKTPIDVFCEEHKKLSQEIKETAKGIAESGMLVSTLVATVAFAAALTIPGNKTNNAWFTVFILTNAVALFASSASLLSFLSNFTSSRFAQSEFVISLHPSLTFGRWLLIISVAAMVVAFTAASFLIFDHTSKWASYAVASMGLFPILMFLLFQFKFFDKLLWSRYYRLSKLD